MKSPEQKLSVFIFLLMFVVAAAAQISYRTDLLKWRAAQEAKLKADNGWLSVVGLFWLKQGDNTIGTAQENDLVLAENSAPARVGTFTLQENKIHFQAATNSAVTLNGQTVQSSIVQSDLAETPDVLRVNDLALTVIQRGEKFGVRVRDKNAPPRQNFSGLHWYEAKEAYRITAKFLPYSEPKEINLVNVLGQTEKKKSPGLLVFTLHNQEYHLEPTLSEGKLFIIFRDLTSGKTTYPAGRFLYADMPVAGEVTLDFNRAINPPCAFTAYATCPLAPRQNYLAVAIEAGAQTYHAIGQSELTRVSQNAPPK